MASSTTPPPTEGASYTKMLIGEVEDVGAHCDFCRQIDFLPFRCESCKGTFCLEHRTETSHKCANAGAWARARAGLDKSTNTATSTRKLAASSTKNKCSSSDCQNEINSLKPGSLCTECDQWYCWTHRMREDHVCVKPTSRVARPTSVLQQQREKGLAALERIRSWKLVKNISVSSPDSKLSRTPSSNSGILSTSRFSLRPKTTADVSPVAERNRLKANAKGDASAVPPEWRVYVHVRADNLSPSAKPRGDFFYDKRWTVGKMLDTVAKSLHVENINNRVGEEQKLRVWRKIDKSGDQWQLLEFGQKLEEAGVITGDELVLWRGTVPPKLDLNRL